MGTEPGDIGWIANGTCINFQKDWTVQQTTPQPPSSLENTTDISDLGTEGWITNTTDASILTTSPTETTEAATTGIIYDGVTGTTGDSYDLTTTGNGNSDNESDELVSKDHYENKSIFVAYMSLYLCELVLVFILFIVFIILSNATGCCYCESNSVDIEVDEEEGYKNDSSSDEDSSDSSSDD